MPPSVLTTVQMGGPGAGISPKGAKSGVAGRDTDNGAVYAVVTFARDCAFGGGNISCAGFSVCKVTGLGSSVDFGDLCFFITRCANKAQTINTMIRVDLLSDEPRLNARMLSSAFLSWDRGMWCCSESGLYFDELAF